MWSACCCMSARSCDRRYTETEITVTWLKQLSCGTVQGWVFRWKGSCDEIQTGMWWYVAVPTNGWSYEQVLHSCLETFFCLCICYYLTVSAYLCVSQSSMLTATWTWLRLWYDSMWLGTIGTKVSDACAAITFRI